MKLSAQNELWRVLAVESGRYAMDNACLVIEDGKGRLVGTNGRVLAVVPVELGEGDEPGLVPREALGAPPPNDEDYDEEGNWYSRPRKAIEPDVRVRNGETSVVIAHKTGEAGEFPDWRAVLPAADAPVAATVKLSPRLLYDLARALGAEGCGLTLRIPVPDKTGLVVRGIRVEGENGAVGVIMPILEVK